MAKKNGKLPSPNASINVSGTLNIVNEPSSEETDEDDKTPEKRESPPLRIDSTLYYAWGMSLNFSGDSKQVDVGVLVKSFWKELKEQKNLHPDDQDYLNQVFTALSAYLRRVGFERDVHARFLDDWEKERKRYIKYLDNMSEMTSLSPESVAVRAGSFVGVGSLGSVLTNKLAISNDLIPLILFFGSIGLFASIGIAKSLNVWLANRQEEKVDVEQQEYWKSVARKHFKTSLLELYRALSALVDQKYELEENDLQNENNAEKLIERILPAEELYDWRVVRKKN
jgi:hypothetical protein